MTSAAKPPELSPGQASLPHPQVAAALQVPLGRTLPHISQLPTLAQSDSYSIAAGQTPPGAAPHSTLALGHHFQGTVYLTGALTVAGELQGQVLQASHGPQTAAEINHVTVTETGRVEGQLQAQEIAILGSTSGLLEAPQGRITLHETAQVRGLVRYAQLQVNGAQIDARLERVRASQTPAPVTPP
jgi:cytoskeletal protein CcmA (bactofilin family)